MLKNKLIDGIIKEPVGGAHIDITDMTRRIKRAIFRNIDELEKMNPEERIIQRIEKFTSMGVVS
jgi:acetyl-CoA carboxylase carboxyl transferase subunit alpha